ncbi:MAG: hypothetical protein KF791_11450 [Verrucomicrobiae bacterium]|nr:hypothetical protein [Verrucomicrobiae bacterium]
MRPAPSVPGHRHPLDQAAELADDVGQSLVPSRVTSRRRAYFWQSVCLVVGAAVVALCVALRPVALPTGLSGHLSKEDRRSIASLVCRDAHQRSWNALRQWDLEAAWRWFRVPRKSRMWSSGRPEDEAVVIQVGADDRSHPDSYRVIVR